MSNYNSPTEEEKKSAEEFKKRAMELHSLEVIAETKPYLLDSQQHERLREMDEAMEASATRHGGYSPLEIISIKRGFRPVITKDE